MALVKIKFYIESIRLNGRVSAALITVRAVTRA